MGNTLFDPELYQKAQEESRYLLQNIVAPPGPPPAAEKPKQGNPTSPVTINIGNLPNLDLASSRTPVPPPAENWLERQRLMSQWAIPTTAGRLETEKAINRVNMMRTGPSVIAPFELALGHEPGVYPIATRAGEPSKAEEPLWMQELRKTGTWSVGPEKFFFGGREVPVGTPGAMSGDELARRRILGAIDMRETSPGVYAAIPPREISTYQAGEYPVMIGGKQVMMPRFVTGVEGAPGAGTREEWANYMARRPTEEPPTWTIPPAIEKQMGDLMKIIQSPDAWSGQRHAAVQAFGNLERMVAEQNRMARGAYEFGAMFPLKEREVAAQEAGIPIRQKEAETHRFATEQLAKYHDQMSKYFNVGAGQTVLNREGKPVYQAPFAPEHTAGIMHWAIAGATEEGLTGKTINPMTFVGLMNMMGSRLGEGYKPITMKEVPKEWITPYIEGRIKKVKPSLKADTEEYKKLHKAYEDLLYMTGQ